jgi:hypothetical protein
VLKQTFKTKLGARGPGGAWTFLHVPFNVEGAFGTKARVPVAGTVGGAKQEATRLARATKAAALILKRAHLR